MWKILLVSTLVFVGSGAIAGEISHSYNRYTIKAGVITYRHETLGGEATTLEKIVLTFDNYGAIEREDEYDDDTLTVSTICSSKSVIRIAHLTKEVTIIPVDSWIFDFRFDWSAVPDSEKITGGAHGLPDRTVAGKPCTAYIRKLPETGGTEIFAGWNKIRLLFDNTFDYGFNRITATNVEEKKEIDPKIFEAPAGYKITKL